jgi:hypothetical protein
VSRRQPPPPSPAHQVLIDLTPLDGPDRIQLAEALRRIADQRSARPAVAGALRRAAQHTAQSLDYLADT